MVSCMVLYHITCIMGLQCINRVDKMKAGFANSEGY
jgi:hypothetical protein